jgi:crotonobetainyl-CoA:carnitine CoA-transferase CaiB-like acyl-CoA transferase
MAGALAGIRILDLTAMITGPMATMILADQGAEVVKIEPPGIGDVMRYLGSNSNGISAMYASCNRNKQSVVVNLATDEGKALIKELAADADVFIQNFRPGVIERLGLGEEVLRADHPELIYVSLNAFGETGPYKDRPAFDHILQGLTGAAYVQGRNEPEYMRQAWVDKATAVNAAQAITAALFARERGAGGQHVRISMLDVGLAFLWPDGHSSTMLRENDAVHLPPIASTYEPAPTKDGAVTIAAVTDDQRTHLLIAMGAEHLLVDPRFATPEAFLENLQIFRDEIRAVAMDLTVEEAIERLIEADVPCGPILRTDEVVDFEQVKATGALVESEHPVMGRIVEPRPPARFEGTPSEIRKPAPALGEDTAAVLERLGRDQAAIEKLRAAGVVG